MEKKLNIHITCILESILWLFSLKLHLITRYNTQILNPGPTTTQKTLSVYYQNVQGLIPFTYLAENHPKFDKLNYVNFIAIYIKLYRIS